MTTPVVLGMAHCGTTMLAECLQHLGVPMTLGGDRGHCEDAGIAHALRKQAWFEAEVATRSGRTWGFKHPGAWRFARYFECLEAPVYLAIYKDPVTVARRYPYQDATLTEPQHIHQTASRMMGSLAGMLSSGLPVRYLSYLDAVRDPYAFTVDLVKICGLGVTEKQVYAASSSIKPLGMSYQ